MEIRAKVMCLILLLSATIAGAQQEKAIPIMEVSEAGAPVRITGLVTARDQPSEATRYSFEGNLDLINASRKPILLIVARVDVVSTLPISLSYSEEDDYFFEPKILQPGSTTKLQRILGEFGEPQRSHASFASEPSARARILFVQFLDGSTWGDPESAERLLRNRKLSVNQLETLEEDYQREGKEVFQKALLKPTLLQPVTVLQDLYHEKRDLTPVLTRLNEMLENARTRSTASSPP
jgi:hypothetical protein